MALPLIGVGEIEYKGKEYSTKEFLKPNEAKKLAFTKVTLSYKEGLALNNGTTVMTAVGTIALHKAEQLLKVSTLTSALIFESLGARRIAFAYPKLHEARNHSGYAMARMRINADSADKDVRVPYKKIPRPGPQDFSL